MPSGTRRLHSPRLARMSEQGDTVRDDITTPAGRRAELPPLEYSPPERRVRPAGGAQEPARSVSFTPSAWPLADAQHGGPDCAVARPPAAPAERPAVTAQARATSNRQRHALTVPLS